MTFLGVLAFLSEGAFTLATITFVLMALGLMAAERAENGQIMAAPELWATALILAIILALNKALEFIHGRRVVRSFIPLNRS
jgi:hypothetical protein